METQTTKPNTDSIRLSGQLSRHRTFLPLKVLYTVTGINLITGLLCILSRYIFTFRAGATAEINGEQLMVDIRYTLFGKEIKKVKTVTPVRQIRGVQSENRNRYIHLVVGFGFLMVGLFCGVHWLLDGIGAGYPYLALLGGGVILAGIAVDLLLYHFIPETGGRRRIVVATSDWTFRFMGVSEKEADAFTRFAAKRFSGPAKSADAPAAE